MTIVRSKWFYLDVDLDISSFVKKIANAAFCSKVGFGFELYKTTDKYFTIKYMEQYKHIERFYDPFGEEEILESVRYRHVYIEFYELSLKYLVRVENMPKSTISLFSNLKRVLDEPLGVSECLFNIPEFLSELSLNSDIKQFKIKQVIISGIYLNLKSRAKIEITSTQNALDDFSDKFKANSYAIDKVKCTFRKDNLDMNLELRKTGTVAHSKALSALLTNELIESM
ncbi:hypothetical protein [Aliivibrio fischeri]|uniref:hypothetical protein n=1 Tax=Aliivibrio fischeri TaxID=668 RepID=UPI00106064C3|nr:hypothetical protein [Aliivibrio fischeri]TDM51488.1 hypothetical protein VFFQA001_15350 [Aliivibrio fischeri]